MDYHWLINSNLVENNIGYKFSSFSEWFKYDRPECLSDGISLGSEDGILLGSLDGYLVGASFVSYGGIKDGNPDSTLVRFFLVSPKNLNITGLMDCHWEISSNLVENSKGYKVFWVLW